MKIKDALIKAFEKREGLYNNSESNCFRIFNSGGDGLDGLSIDLYGEYLLVQSFSESVKEQLESSPELKTNIIKAAAVLPFNIAGVLLKNRLQIIGNQDYTDLRKSKVIEGQMPPEDYTVKQNGIAAGVSLVEGQSTGIFLDMREVRDALVPFYQEHKPAAILNLFSYTALFSVHAAKNGAGYPVNVDLSKVVLRRARNNYSLNNLECDDRDFIFGDAFDWIRRFKKKEKTFAFAIVDPPSFSRHRKRTFSAKRNMKSLLDSISEIVPEGHLLTAVNHDDVTKQEYISFHPIDWKNEMLWNESSDFPYKSRPYLKVGLWRCG